MYECPLEWWAAHAGPYGELLKIKQKRPILQKINASKNKIKIIPEEIAEEFANYYELLHKKKDRDNDQIKLYLNNVSLPKMTCEQKAMLAKPITVSEVYEQIQKLQTGTTPGDDGFTNEFYKKFKNQITPLLMTAYNYALKMGIWGQTWQSALIPLIFKEGRDATKCSSYRPISLLNTDYKITTGVIANRLKKCIVDITEADQCGFITGRLLSDNIRRTINAEKAFDLVRWPFLFETLDSIYCHPTSRVKTNGMLSRWFTIQRGIRQDDLQLAFLFIMYIDVLAAAIRQKKNISRVQIEGEVYKLALNADDIIIYFTQPEKSLPKLMETIVWF
uniref:Reverse transcriptase domain-containing protein n=1 Tax=Stegastes partitus TaxID=144197 RepID=A0A3B5A5L8_9TELE